jgi:hypothetical protein
MSKRNEVITAAARKAGALQTLSDQSPAFAAIAAPIANYMRKLTDAQPAREELPGHFTGVIVRKGKITDVVASNGAVKIEE